MQVKDTDAPGAELAALFPPPTARDLAGERYAALYVRVSTGRQRDNWSVKDQLGLARLGEARGLKVVVYNEGAESSETLEGRPAMMRLLRDVQAGRVAVIICVATSRLSRDEDIIDTLTIQAACRANDTLVVTPEQVYDYSTRAGTIFGQIKAVFDADAKQETIKATTRGRYKKAREGGWTGGIAPFGYGVVFDVPHVDGRPRGRLVVDPDEAEVVRCVYRWYTEGRVDAAGDTVPMSARMIARALNDDGLRYRTRRSQKEDGKNRRKDGGLAVADAPRLFEAQDIRRILKQRYYLGLFTHGEKQTSKWVRDEGSAEVHRPDLQVIDVVTWQRAQRVRQERATMPRRTACSPRPLVGLLRCPHCGGLMSGHILVGGAKGREGDPDYLGYHCRNHRAFGAAVCGKGAQVSEPTARAAVEAELIEHLEGLRLQRFLDRAAEDASGDVEGQIAQGLLRELQQVDDGLDRLIDAVAEGVYSNAEVRAKKLALMEKKERLEGRLKRLREKAQARDGLAETIAAVQADLRGHIRDLDGAEFRQLARLVFAHLVVVGEGGGRNRWARVRSHRHSAQFEELTSTLGAYVPTYDADVEPGAGPLAALLAALSPAP